jgi:cytochrome P450
MPMSFPFKTGNTGWRKIEGMNTSAPSNCPFHAGATVPSPVLHPLGAWPPGPPAGVTGWGLLKRMSRDLLSVYAEWQRDYGDLVHLRIWPEHQVMVTDPQLVRELLVSHHDSLIRWERGMRVFSQVQGHSTLTAEGEAWRMKRRTLHPSFSAKAVQAFVPTITAAVEKALMQWPVDGTEWPIESALTSLTMDVIVRMMFSTEVGDDARTAERAVHDVLVAANGELYWPASWPDWAPWKRAKRKGLRVLNGLIDRHIDTRLKLPFGAWPEDLLARLLTLHRKDAAAWPLKAVRDECMGAFFAGHETTAASLTWWAWCMAANPSAQSAARREVQAILQGRIPTAADLPSLGYLTATLQETLRLYPTAPVLLTRRATRPITLGGWQFPARTMFTVPVQLMHRDPRWFLEPQAFRPERFADEAPEVPRGAFMPFGTGPRVCLGQHLAMTEMTIVAAMILQRFVLSAPEGMQAPQPVFHISLRPNRPLCLGLSAAPSGDETPNGRC